MRYGLSVNGVKTLPNSDDEYEGDRARDRGLKFITCAIAGLILTFAVRQRYKQLLAKPESERNSVEPARALNATNSSNTNTSQSVADELAKLHGLFKSGAITETEYVKAKSKCLGIIAT